MSETQTVVVRVTVDGIVPGDPPVLAWSKRLHGAMGQEKPHSQRLAILDDSVLRRLEHSVRAGDDIIATIVTTWDDASYASYLADFSTPEVEDGRPRTGEARNRRRLAKPRR